MENLKHIAVSLEYAERLKKAGWPQEEPILFWTYTDEYTDGDYHEWVVANLEEWKFDKKDDIAAPTAEEILATLPPKIPKNPTTHSFDAYLSVQRLLPQCPLDAPSQGWKVIYEGWDSEFFQAFGRTTMADAAAAMYCFLKEKDFFPKP